MRVIDTSAWIEYLLDSPTAAKIAPELPARDECLVPTIVQFELAKWLMREASQDLREATLAETMKCHVVELDTAIALRAAELSREHGLSCADAIIYATSQVLGADLLTCDAHFRNLPGVLYFVKVRQ